METNILDTMEGQTLEYVPVPGPSEEKDFEGLDLTGKVALVARGSINFDVKAANAAAVGAVAIIIYNNTDEGLFYASLQPFHPGDHHCQAGRSGHAGCAGKKKITFSSDYYGKALNYNGYQVSSFSSIGPAPTSPSSRKLLPLVDRFTLRHWRRLRDHERHLHGHPHMAGEAAVLRQYLKETYPNLSDFELGELANSLLMSTAVPSWTMVAALYFSVRRQGAGVANVYYAIVSGAYLSVEGSNWPKAEVGSSENGTYTYTATVHNLTDGAKTYF